MSDTVDTDDLRYDANQCWKPWHEKLIGFANEAAAAGEATTVQDWGFAPGSSDAYAAWCSFATQIHDYYLDGSTIFEGIARKLLTDAITAEEADGSSADEIRQTQLELDKL